MIASISYINESESIISIELNNVISAALSRRCPICPIQHRVVLIIERQIEHGLPLDRGHDRDVFEPRSILSTYLDSHAR